MGSKACPVVRECKDVVEGIKQGDFKKVAAIAGVLGVSALAGGGGSGKVAV